MGDEDEDQPESNLVWLNYFLKPIENATQIICTEKANGEAAHLSARFIKNKVSSLGVGVPAWSTNCFITVHPRFKKYFGSGQKVS